LNIKKENEGLEKQVNKLAKQIQLKTYLQYVLLTAILLCGFTSTAQDVSYGNAKKYTLADITVKGNTNFNEQTIITFSRLKKGDEILIPGEKISAAIKKLWGTNLFNDIEIYLTKTEGSNAYLEIRLTDLPELTEVKITGVKKSKKEKIITENKLNKGAKVTENLIATTKNYLESKFKKEGYLNSKVNINTIKVEDSTKKSRVKMLVAVDKGEKFKIKDISFNGNTVFSDKKLRRNMSNTKKKRFFRFLKRSKYIENDYKEDLVAVIDKYKENGYRDARILSDTITKASEDEINLAIDIEEGAKYTFGDITFIGNTVYSDALLKRVLRIEKGDTYNGVLLQKRIADDTKPDGDDITNLYQDSGYLFSTINPVEINTKGNVIDMEIRISEGKPVHFNKITVVGNDKTNDHVIYRELRTHPGDLYKKSDVIRSVRELSQIGYFDAQQISPNFLNPNPNDGTIDVEYAVVEAGSSQIELQGGYGGGSFIGTLGLSFNNFSIKDIFKKDAYKPLPTGDGQKLGIRAQASRFYRTYSLSFSEPWLGGKKPLNFSTSLSYSQQFLFDNVTRTADKDKRFNITGLTVGLAKRLTVPDDYFTLSQALSFQHYDLKNYNTGLFTFGNGSSRNLSYTVGLSRNNSFNDPIFPTGGSNFNVTAKMTLPYSSFNGVDYTALKNERDEMVDVLSDSNSTVLAQTNANTRISEIDQERFKWLEFYKVKFKGEWYTKLVDDFVFKSSIELGFLGAYNQDRGTVPFERFYLGGDGLGSFSLDGREAIALRGYPNQSLSTTDGGTIYNKFSLELRYPITLKQAAKIYVLGFLEAGNSYDGFKEYNPFDLKRSTGLGLRLFMPQFGLLGIDFGYGFDSVPGQTGRNGFETHFIIGQQF
jgi:outer membrane protein insertion porin family